MLLLVFALVFVTLNVWLARVQFPLRNTVLRTSTLPAGYYHRGDYKSQCTVLKAANDEEDAFKYCEDLVSWKVLNNEAQLEEERLIITCDAGRNEWNTVMGPLHNSEPHGSLWIYSSPKPASTGDKLKSVLRGKPQPQPQRITLQNYPAGHDFHPLGADIHPSYGGNSSFLFVVNHAGPRSSIEQFMIYPTAPTTAIYVRTILHDDIHSPNALTLTSPTSFYLTNDHTITRRHPHLGKFVPLLETVATLPTGWVSHFTLDDDITSANAVISHSRESIVAFPNGIAMSPSGTEVAVASSSLNYVYLYTRDLATNKLKSKASIRVPFAPDNLHYTADGTILVAGHPNFVKLSTDKLNSPSWVVAISPRAIEHDEAPKEFDLSAPISASQKVMGVRTHDLETWYQGSAFQTSSTAVQNSVSGELFVSGLYASGLLVCRPV